MSSLPDPEDARPVRFQIADVLRKEFAPGVQLATINELAERWGVAKETIRAAVKLLQTEGLVVTWQGRGTFYVAEKPADEVTTTDILERLDAMMDQLEALDDRVAKLESQAGKSDR